MVPHGYRLVADHLGDRRGHRPGPQRVRETKPVLRASGGACLLRRPRLAPTLPKLDGFGSTLITSPLRAIPHNAGRQRYANAPFLLRVALSSAEPMPLSATGPCQNAARI